MQNAEHRNFLSSPASSPLPTPLYYYPTTGTTECSASPDCPYKKTEKRREDAKKKAMDRKQLYKW